MSPPIASTTSRPGSWALGNLDGLLVTVPFKARMFPFASRVGPAAQIVAAINALRKEGDGSWTGDMFDGAGFVRANERKGHEIRGRRVLLFGAGGAGSAIACALADAGVRSIAIVDVDGARAESLAEPCAVRSRHANRMPSNRNRTTSI